MTKENHRTPQFQLRFKLNSSSIQANYVANEGAHEISVSQYTI
jgi:hypothetical protein